MSKKISMQDFLDVIGFLQNSVLSASEFCASFTHLWMQYRDAVYDQQKEWGDRRDIDIIEQWKNGQLDAQEFESQWVTLYNHQLSTSFRTMIDQIHSACSVFSPEPEATWEINENMLRKEVDSAWEQYNKQKDICR